ncbi:MAG: hypothetical protein AABX83_00740 [Nanoarchaeota archaeon]
MVDLEDQLTELHKQKKQILGKIDVRNKNRRIKCGGCEDSHKIRDLTAIQTHWYTSPHGCTGGDYWNEGELQFICPETGIINRLLFNNHDVPWEERDNYTNDPEEQFKINYKGLFKEVKDSYDKTTPNRWVNNYYADQNRKKFRLVEKRK